MAIDQGSADNRYLDGARRLPTAGTRLERSLAEVVWHRRGLALLGLAIGLAGALAYYQWAPRTYTSMAVLEMEPNAARGLGREPNLQDSAVESYRNTQAQVIVSRPLREATLARPDVRGLAMWAHVGDPMQYLHDQLEAQTGKKDALVTVTLKSTSASDGAMLLEALTNTYMAWQAEQTASAISQMIASLQEENDVQQKELARRQKTLLDFKIANQVLTFDSDKSNTALERLERLSGEMTTAQLAAIEADARLKAATAFRSSPAKLRQFAISQPEHSLTTPSDALHDSLYMELNKQESDAAALGKHASEEHPSMRMLRASIARIKESIAEEDRRFVDNYIAALEQNSMKASQQFAAIQAAFKAQQNASIDLSSKALEYAQLDSAFKQTEQVCHLLGDRIRDLQVSAKGPDWVLRLIEPPVAPQNPSSPRRSRVFGVGLGAGLALGALLALARELRDQRLQTIEEIGEAMGLPVLGIVPHLRRAERVRVVSTQVQGDALEAFRAMRASLYCSPGWRNGKTLMVTSAAAGEGKSTTVSNLAETLARAGRRVLIVDADFRRPTQQTIFGLPLGLGLQDVLAGQIDWRDAVQHTKNPHVDLLASGSALTGTRDRLYDQTFPGILEELATHYDHVLVDSPPLLSVAEARILARHCAATILVARAGQTTRRACAQACRSLASARAIVLGVVINDAPRGAVQIGYYDYAEYRDGEFDSALEFLQAPRRPGLADKSGRDIARLDRGSPVLGPPTAPDSP
jgi:polysaccharide biosynthesis transport protein